MEFWFAGITWMIQKSKIEINVSNTVKSEIIPLWRKIKSDVMRLLKNLDILFIMRNLREILCKRLGSRQSCKADVYIYKTRKRMNAYWSHGLWLYLVQFRAEREHGSVCTRGTNERYSALGRRKNGPGKRDGYSTTLCLEV